MTLGANREPVPLSPPTPLSNRAAIKSPMRARMSAIDAAD